MLLRLSVFAALLILPYGCATQPTPAQFMRVSPQSAPSREARTRHFTDVSESGLLAAGVSVMQDLGFRIKASDAKLGVIVGVKQRSFGDIFGDIGRLSLLAGVTFGLYQTPEISMGPADAFGIVVTMRPAGTQTGGCDVRVMFFQLWSYSDVSPDVTRTRGAVVIHSPTLYQKFFEMLGANLARARSGN